LAACINAASCDNTATPVISRGSTTISSVAVAWLHSLSAALIAVAVTIPALIISAAPLVVMVRTPLSAGTENVAGYK